MAQAHASRLVEYCELSGSHEQNFNHSATALDATVV
jgi:hypothetical protein